MGLGRNQRRAQKFRGTGGSLGEDNFNKNTSNNKNKDKVGRGGTQKLQYNEILRGIGLADGGKVNSKSKFQWSEEVDGWEDEEMSEEVNRSLATASDKETVTRIGDMTRDRPDGVFRIMAGNVNNMSNSIVRQRKIGEFQQAIDYWDVQGVGLSEVGIDFRKMGPSRQMSSWFRGNRENYKTSAAHNTRYPAISYSQPGGIGLIACKELKQYIQGSKGDFRKLGRWNSWILGLNPAHRTRIVVAYQVGKTTSKAAYNTIFLQHHRYIQQKGICLTPRELFQQDFISNVRRWRGNGERLVIFMDFNEHILKGKLPRMLQDEGLVEISSTRWAGVEPKTYFRGSTPIDGIYASQELEIHSVMVLPFHESIGDHRTMLVDITTRSAVGEQQYKIVRPEARRLSTKNKKSTTKYLASVENAFSHHKLFDKLGQLEKDFERGMTTAVYKKRAQEIDETKIKIMKAAEKKCRKLTSQYNLPCSPEIQRVNRLCRAYKDLRRWIEGISKNSNIIKAASRAGIEHPRQLTLKQCYAGEMTCQQRLRSLERRADTLRREHLGDRLLIAKRGGDDKKEKAIKEIMTNEKSKEEWKRIKFAIGTPLAGATTKIQKMVNGVMIEITDVEVMNRDIQECSRERFTLAYSAPIQRSSLKNKLGPCSETVFARHLLEGHADIPPEVDSATRALIEEMMSLWEKMHSKHEPPLITPYNYKGHWGRTKEGTSSAMSNIHFGHWKAFLQSAALIDFECRNMTLIARSGIPPDRWSKGLQVMLEKTPGVSLVDKLRFILLMEGDKNAYNRMLIGYKAMRQLEEIHYIPEDQYSQRGGTAEDSKLDNRLTLDLSRQMVINMTAISADADKCYDRINHIVMALALRAVCGDPCVAKSMLEAIQNMKYFQRTGRGDSNTFLVMTELLQGICQGNTAGPACWVILSSIMIRCYEKAGHGSKLLSLIALCLDDYHWVVG